MSIYSTQEGIEQYIEMSKEYDGFELIEKLKERVPENATVLELGMGEGKDQILLKEAGFNPTASDSSEPFIAQYNKDNEVEPAIFVDAITMDIDESYNAIYANKVLQHLSEEEFTKSLKNQAEHLTSKGYLLFSLWYGTDSGNMGGVFYMSHTEQTLVGAIPESLELITFSRYTEMDENDSFWVILQKRN